MSFLDCVLMLSIDSIIFFILTIYKVKTEHEYRNFKSFFFFLYPSYWKILKASEISMNNILYGNLDDMIEMEREVDIEPVSKLLKPDVVLKNIKKKYVPQNKVVTHKIIDNLNLMVYPGQITAVLGK